MTISFNILRIHLKNKKKYKTIISYLKYKENKYFNYQLHKNQILQKFL